MKIYKYSVGAMGTNSYIVCDEASGEAFMTDPGAHRGGDRAKGGSENGER